MKSRLAQMLVLGAVVLGAAPAMAQLQYFSVAPCRLIETRTLTPAPVPIPPYYAAGAFATNTTRSYRVQEKCGVPTNAQAISFNVTATQGGGNGNIRLWAAGGATPLVSNLNFTNAAGALANGGIVGLTDNASPNDDLSIRVENNTVHLILDVTGYFCAAGGGCV